jgi:O-antigen/teichoic acid export membrane protein
MKTSLELSRDSLCALISHLAPRFANTLLFILVGHLAGPTEAGILSLAITYLLISTTLMRGLDDLVVRQVSREPDEAGSYLTSFLLLRFPLSSVLYGALILAVQTLFDYDQQTHTTILILALSLVPDSLCYVAQSVFLGMRQFGTPAAILASISSFKLVAGGLGLILGRGLDQIAWLWPVGSTAGAIILIFSAARRIGGVQRSDWLDWHPVAQHWRDGMLFLFITTMTALETQTDTVILSGYHGEAEVGWYGAATTVAYGLTMFSQAYRFAVYPLMARYALRSPGKLSQLYENSVRYLGTFILPVAAGIIVLSPEIVLFVFGSEFRPSITVLRVLTVAPVFMFLNEPNVRMMLVKDRQNLVSLFLVGSVTTNLVMNLALAPSHGALGAAIARACSTFIFFLLNMGRVASFPEHRRSLHRLLRPLTATVLMALVVWIVRAWSPLVSVFLGALSYGIALWLVGGISDEEIAATHRFLTHLRSSRRAS